MSWSSVSKAAATLQISERQLYRRIRAGTLETARQGGRTLVDVPDTTDGLTSAVDKMSQVAAASTITHDRNVRQTSELTSVLSNVVLRAEKAETRAYQVVRWSVGTVAAVMVTTVGAAVWAGLQFHQTVLGHQVEVSTMTAEHTESRVALEGRLGSVQATVEEQAAALTAATARAAESGAETREAVIERNLATARADDLAERLEIAEKASWIRLAAWAEAGFEAE